MYEKGAIVNTALLVSRFFEGSAIIVARNRKTDFVSKN